MAVAPEQSLRARKKAAAMRHIQQVALELISSKGFDKVTVEEVAAAAEVSPSSIYRYFG
ncbi:MAG: TetR family transcriptional regulator, partial [Micrococcales bacterium]